MRIQKIIDTLTGEPGRRAAEAYPSATQDIQASRILDHEKYGSRIVLVDTPGFDNSSKSDTEVLKPIGDLLVKTYAELHPRRPDYPNNHIRADTGKEYY